MNDISVEAPGRQPARQSEAIATRFEGDDDALDLACCLERQPLRTAARQPQVSTRMPLDARHNPQRATICCSTAAINVLAWPKAVKDFLPGRFAATWAKSVG